jgi:hypothetical protein
MPRTSILPFLALTLLGCHVHETTPPTDGGVEEAGPSCTLPFAGDPAKPLQVELIALQADLTSAPLVDGGTIALLPPPQGGFVVFVGVRATNIDPCAVQLEGAVRDPNPALKQAPTTIDYRTVNLDPTGDGWAESPDDNISKFANIPVCPNQWASANIYGNPYEVIMTVVDRDKVRTATVTTTVVPSCANPEAGIVSDCLCNCQGGYMLGEVCDGGSTEAGP